MYLHGSSQVSEQHAMPMNSVGKQPRSKLGAPWRRFPRLSVAALSGVLAAIIGKWPMALPAAGTLVLGWNVCAALYLLLSIHFVARSTHGALLARASAEDAGSGLIATIVVLASVLSLVSIVTLLGQDKAANELENIWHVALPIITIMVSWAFIHFIFSFHYAHAFYAEHDYRQSPSLIFPGKAAPGYTDFLYFSFIIGTSGQTADVNIASRRFRVTALFHCVLSYLFNAAILSLLINVIAGQIK